MKSFSFNGNKSRIVFAWSNINQAHLVWREDTGHQTNVRVHTRRDDAAEDYAARVRFVKKVTA